MLHYNIPADQKLTKKQEEIIFSGKDFKELTSEELREVYYFIDSPEGVLSATKINTINSYYKIYGHLNNLKNFKDDFNKVSITVGTEIHKAAETKGESLKNLYIYPEDMLVGATDYEKHILKEIAEGKDPMLAYISKYKTALSPEEYESNVFYVDKASKVFIEIKEKVDKLVKKYDAFLSTVKLIQNTESTLVSKTEYYTICDCYKAIVEHEEASWLLLTESTENIEVFSELAILYELQDLLPYIDANEYDKFEEIKSNCLMKSMFDRVIVNHIDKTVTLVDIKTFSKSCHEFIESYIHWGYFRQMSLYYYALKMYMCTKDTKYENYSFHVKIVPISTKYKNIKYIEEVSYNDLRNSIRGFFKKRDPYYYNRDNEIEYANGSYNYLDPITKKYQIRLMERATELGWLAIIQLYLNRP